MLKHAEACTAEHTLLATETAQLPFRAHKAWEDYPSTCRSASGASPEELKAVAQALGSWAAEKAWAQVEEIPVRPKSILSAMVNQGEGQVKPKR